MAEPSFVIKDAWAERFWTVIVFKDAATRGATEGLSFFGDHVGSRSANDECRMSNEAAKTARTRSVERLNRYFVVISNVSDPNVIAAKIVED